MNEFDGKKFYGFSLHNDPALSTTTRNFEFKYARPEHLERAIQKVQHNDPDNERNRKKDVFNRMCKSKKLPTTTEVNKPYQRDADVETHVSRGDAAGRVRALSNIEINQLIDKVRSYSDLRAHNSTDTYAKDKETVKSTKPPSILKSILRPTTNEFPRGGAVGGTYYPNMRTNQSEEHCEELSGEGDAFCSDPTSEDQILCNPFDLTHESFFETHTMHLPHVRRELHSGLSKLPDVPEEDELLASKTVMPTLFEEYRQVQPKWVEIHEEPAKAKVQFAEIKMPLNLDNCALVSVHRSPDRDEDDERLPTNVTYTKHSHEMQLPLQISAPEMMLTNMPPPPSLPNMSLTYAMNSYEDTPSTYHVEEDSDLEYEMIGRPEYTKFCGPRPNTEELMNTSVGSGGLAEFVEIEPKVPCMNLSFLKNVSPIRYSDMTDDRDDDRTTESKQQMKVIIKSRGKKSPSPVPEKEVSTVACKDAKKKIPKPKKKSVEEVKPSPRKKVSARCTDTPPLSLKEKSPHAHTPRSSGRRSVTSSPRHQKDRAHQTSNLSSNELRAMKNIVLTKSIEDLKIEKMGIFAKMTSTQERIIEALDKLRISLLELYVPDSHYENSRRQKNAFEFSVRFSRNFLYPLKGMIEDLRLVSVEQLCSASSNEATQRVLNIFVLIQQSLQTYYKQLRYFLLDQVPQKLNTLIELASTTINICLEKQVFDRNDAIIECLQERCSKFLGFLEDMHEERFLTARDNYRKAFDKTASNYSLKMFMNDLNMYEPKLVPKNHYNLRRKPKQRRVLKPSSTNTKVKSDSPVITTPKTSQMVITKPDGDHISTHVNELSTSSGLFHSSQQIPADRMVPPAEPSRNSEDSPNLNRALIEALQTVTKEQMRQVLQPIMQTLGSVLEKKNASKTIEELLNAFSKNLISLAEGEQTKKINPEQYSGNKDKVRGAEELKAAKQTERQHSRHRHSNIVEANKRCDDPTAAFFGNLASTNNIETAICDDNMDDDDDDNYYDDDGFEPDNGGTNDDDDDDDDDDVDDNEDNEDDDDDYEDGNNKTESTSADLIETTEPTVSTIPSGFTGATNSVGYFNDMCADNSKMSSSKIVVFDNFNLCGGDGGNCEVDDVGSDSGSDFESFEGTSSQFDVVVAMKPDKNKANEQQQQQVQQQQQHQLQQQKEEQQLQQTQQQQQKQHQNKKQQQQQQQQQQEKKEQKQQFETLEQHKQSKQQQQQLLQQQIQVRQQERQHHKILRERAENYDTHIKHQQQLLAQQAYEEQQQQQRQLKKQTNAGVNNDKDSTPEQIFKKSRDLQKQLQTQMEEHQRYIAVQQQQRRLHQKQLKEQQLLEREEELNMKDHQKKQQQQQELQQQNQKQQQQHTQQEQQQQQQNKKAPLLPPKPLMRKQLQSQQQQPRPTVPSRHSSRASSSRPPSSRASPLLTTSRGRLTTRAKNITSTSRPSSQGENPKVVKKRRNPLNSPPPAPSVTPLNSARTPRTPRNTVTGPSIDFGDGMKIIPNTLKNCTAPSLKSSFTKDICFADNSVGDVGGGDADVGITSDNSQSQMLKLCSKLKTDFIDMMVPLTNAFHTVNGEGDKNEQQHSAKSPRQPRSSTKKSEALANHDLIEALTNCLFNFNSTENESFSNIVKDQKTTQEEEGGEVRDAYSSKSVTLYTGDSPYEKLKRRNAQQRSQKSKRKSAQKGMCKESTNKEEVNDCEKDTKAYENENVDYKTQTNTGDCQDVDKKLKPLASPCTLWNSNLKSNTQKKDLHIKELIAERDHFLTLCSKNRFYANPNFNQPWSVFSKLAARLSNDIVSMIEEDFSIGVSKFVQDFLDNETKI